MESKKKKPLYLLALGALIMSIPFVLRHFMSISDRTDGLIRGFGIGLMVVAVISSAKRKRTTRDAA